MPTGQTVGHPVLTDYDVEGWHFRLNKLAVPYASPSPSATQRGNDRQLTNKTVVRGPRGRSWHS